VLADHTSLVKTYFYIGANRANRSGISAKLWQIARQGRRLTSSWGPAEFCTGTRKVLPVQPLQSQHWTFRSEQAARAEEARRIAEKLREGYQRQPRRRSAPRGRQQHAERGPAATSRTAAARKASKEKPASRWTPPLHRLRALSLRQPWAWLVVNGYKDIENRSWRTTHRGALLIHASSTTTDFTTKRLDAIAKRYGVRVPDTVDIGGIVGVVDVVDCVLRHKSKWKFPGCWGWVLENRRRLPFRECKGAVGFFYPKLPRR
jgi:predicted DNA-binding WGR domain protein